MNKALGIVRFVLVSSATVAVLFWGTQSTSHALTLGFDDFVNPIFYVNDSSAQDFNPAVGAVTFLGSIGPWTVNVTTGISKPVIGSGASPKLDLNSVDVTSAGRGHLRFWVVDSDFTAAGPFEFRVGGTTEGTVSFSAFVDASNNEQFVDDEFAYLGPFSSSAFSGSLSGSFNATGPFALGIIGNITHTGHQISSFNADLRVIPEPASLLLLGIGLISLAGYGRRKFSKK
jgi:hypothetical protein